MCKEANSNLKMLLTALLPISAVLMCLSPALAMDDGELSGPYCTTRSPSCLAGKVFFVNGMHVSADVAIDEARQTAARLKSPTYLIWNDMDLSAVDDANAAFSEFVGSDAFNGAFDTLMAQVRAEIESGRSVFVVGFSAGAMIARDCVCCLNETYEDRPDDERCALLSRIHLLLVAAPCDPPPSDVALGSVYRLLDKADPIVQCAGEGNLIDVVEADPAAHFYLGNYLPHVTTRMFSESGKMVLDYRER